MSTSAVSVADYFLKWLGYFRDPIIVLLVVSSWMTFSVLNRPLGTEHDAISDTVYWGTLVMAIFSSFFMGLLFLRYTRV